MSVGSVILLAAMPAANTQILPRRQPRQPPITRASRGADATPHAMAPPLSAARPGRPGQCRCHGRGRRAMIHMAQAMDEAAALMLDDDPQLVDLGQHWVLDAQALRQQAAWMVLSATAADMIHDPATGP